MTERTALYRHFDANGVLLYVGISLNAFYRLHQHGRKAKWVDKICNMTIENFETREEAIQAEELAIKVEKPRHNIVHNGPRADLMGKKGPKPKPRPARRRLAKVVPLRNENRLPPAPPGDRWIPTVTANAYIGYRTLPMEDAQAIYFVAGKVRRGQKLWLKSTLDRKFMKLPKYVRDGLAVAA